MTKSVPQKLVVYLRDGLAEQEHFGYIVRCNRNEVLGKIGNDGDYPYFLRSCAKPLQASLIIDYGLDKSFEMTEEEIAVCCASHAGEECHTKIISNLLNKFEITEDMLKCGKHAPISKTAQDELLLKGVPPSQIHNNCSGKHTMMLGLCKINGWDVENYDNINHPLQQKIKQKIYELCELKKEYPITKDGCGVPIHSMPLKNMVIGYLNLFCNNKYEKIKNAFLNNPYIIGGEDRTDTKIIQNTTGLVAKVGAGGLCIVVNTKKEEGFVVKICDADMNAREIVCVDYIEKLGWGKVEVSRDIKTLHNDIVGEIVTNFSKKD